MKTSRLIIITMLFLLIFPIVYAGVEEEQLKSIMRQVKDSIGVVKTTNKHCLNSALAMLHERIDELIGAQAFLGHITNPLQHILPFKWGLALSTFQQLTEEIDNYLKSGGVIVSSTYKPGWIRWIFGDECKPFNLQFLWFKSLNKVRIISSGDCNCKNDIDDFYIQFDVTLRENERVSSEARNRYEVVGFESVHPYNYFEDPQEESNSLIKVNCCKKCGDKINWETEESEEVGFSTPRKELFADPDEFLASLESGKFTLSQKEREDFMRGTLCTKIDTLPRPTPTPDVIYTPTPTKVPDPTRTPTKTQDPTRTPTPVTTRDPVLTPTPTLPPVISTKTPTQTPIDCNQVCASKEWSTQKKDWSSYIFSEVSKYTCVSGAKITQPGSYKMGPCICYDPNEKPKIEIDTRIPFCKDTFCGDVPCGEKRNCQPEPTAAYSATCKWEGWKMGSSGLPTPVLDVY